MSAIGQGTPAETQLVLERRIAELRDENESLRLHLERMRLHEIENLRSRTAMTKELAAIRDSLKSRASLAVFRTGPP